MYPHNVTSVKFSFIAHMPDTPGALHRAAEIIKKHDGNINRLQYDHRIDAGTVFYEVTATDEAYAAISRELAAIGYLQTSVRPPEFLKFCVHMPHTPGALYELLNHTTAAGANIAFIDFDDRGRHPYRLTVSLNLDEGTVAGRLLDELKSQYRMEILEYDSTGRHLDDTVFYLRFAQSVREIAGDTGDSFLLAFLAETNHMAQELMDRGCDPRRVFDSVLATGRSMHATNGPAFYADVQRAAVTDRVSLFCFQLPCGGNIFVLDSPEETVMIDTGYGIYHEAVIGMLSRFGCGDPRKLSRIIVTHADADHCGAAGFFSVPVFMHEGTLDIIRTNNRAFGSASDHATLDAFYTRMINLFSKFATPADTRLFGQPAGRKRSIFPVIGQIRIGDITLEILDGLGGHTHGQVFLFSGECGLLFTADSVINFASLTKERAAYSSLAAFLVTSVNVDSGRATRERNALLALAAETDTRMQRDGRRCLICGGHGAVSVLDDGKLAIYGTVDHYRP